MDAMDKKEIEELAENNLLAPPVMEMEDGNIDPDSFLEELEIVEEVAGRKLAEGEIPPDFYNGVLTTTVGLRKTLEDIE